MKVLICCNQIPFPLKDGYSIACMHLAEGLLSQGIEVDILAYNTSKKPLDSNSFSDELKNKFNWHFINIDNKVNILGALAALIKGKNYNISRFNTKHILRGVSKIISQNNYDIIQLEGLYMAPLIPVIKREVNVKVSYRSHNIEFKIWQLIAKNSKGVFKRLYLKFLSSQLKTYEKSIWEAVDCILPISKKDLLYIKDSMVNNELKYLAFGLNLEKIEIAKKPLDLFFIGSLDWLPNTEGLNWFIKEIWPEIKKIHTNIKFHIAGRNMPSEIFALNDEKIIVHGEVESAHEFMNSHGIMLVPLLSGSGVRIKIIEGLSQGNCILSTSIGAEGLFSSGDEHILIADNKKAFLENIELCKRDNDLIKKTGEKALAYAHNNHNIEIISKDLLAYYNKLIAL
jgi:glycosyltransferase involved in cell wall biosynthesis